VCLCYVKWSSWTHELHQFLKTSKKSIHHLHQPPTHTHPSQQPITRTSLAFSRSFYEVVLLCALNTQHSSLQASCQTHNATTDTWPVGLFSKGTCTHKNYLQTRSGSHSSPYMTAQTASSTETHLQMICVDSEECVHSGEWNGTLYTTTLWFAPQRMAPCHMWIHPPRACSHGTLGRRPFDSCPCQGGFCLRISPRGCRSALFARTGPGEYMQH